MKPENNKKLSERFSFMRSSGDLRKDLLVFGCECGDGWFQILWDLCSAIDILLEKQQDEEHPFRVMQVKEKYGGLRFYTNWETEEISNLISEAEAKSYETCEICGKPGEPNEKGWIRTLCEECRERRTR